MGFLLATTIISCTDAVIIVNRLSNVIGLTYNQKIEIVKTLKEYVPSCPIYIKQNNKYN